MTNHRAIMAACNNADWYCMMFDIHELSYSRSAIAFIGNEPPPAYHSWMTTTEPDAVDDLLQLIRQNAYRPKFVVKDAFDCLDLCEEDFVELFSATWIYADSVRQSSTLSWVKIETVDDLMLWEDAWRGGRSPAQQRHFHHAILSRDDVMIWGRKASVGFDAGVVANISKDCVGLSNCFGQNAFPAAATLCAELSRGKLPIVGYERGNDRATAISVGFTALGNLRIWSR